MDQFDLTLNALRATAETTRLRALLLLAEGELTVSELTQILGQSQPRVSRHLKILAEAGLVERHQEGAWTFYRLGENDILSALGIVRTQRSALALPVSDQEALALLRKERTAAAKAYFADQALQWERLRALHIDEATIETRLKELAGDRIETFLDLGTGTGRMLIVFRDLYARGIGLDSSAEMLSVARSQLGDAQVLHAQVRRGDFLEDPLPEDVDVACFHHVLHFLRAPERALAAAADSMTDAGRILIADFAPHDREELREEFAHWRLGFSDEEISAWAARCGLKITASEQFAPPVKGGLTSTIWRLERANRARRPVLSPSHRSDHAPA